MGVAAGEVVVSVVGEVAWEAVEVLVEVVISAAEVREAVGNAVRTD